MMGPEMKGCWRIRNLRLCPYFMVYLACFPHGKKNLDKTDLETALAILEDCDFVLGLL